MFLAALTLALAVNGSLATADGSLAGPKPPHPDVRIRLRSGTPSSAAGWSLRGAAIPAPTGWRVRSGSRPAPGFRRRT